MTAFGIETHRSFVNTWECDLNNHLNVQFYWKRFGDALQIYSQASGQEQLRWTDRHVRYHGELSNASDPIIHSAQVDDPGTIAHVMTNSVTGELSATAVDRCASGSVINTDLVFDFPEGAHPRSLPADTLLPIDTEQVIKNGTGLISHLSVVMPNECDLSGSLSDQHHIARFSDAASHFWHHMGVSTAWMGENGCGSVAVEMKATRHNPVPAGTIVQVVTWLDQISSKVLTFRHQVSDLTTGQPLYSGAVAALLMDLTTRRAVKLPEVISDRV